MAFRFFAGPHALLLGTALLAYTFGLRHAVDADHISAIDNVTRKLIADGKRPVGVGLFFALGHSTIVVALTLAVVFGATPFRSHFLLFERFGGALGTGVSAIFLFAIAAMNVIVLIDAVKTLHCVRAGGSFCERSLHQSLQQRGVLGCIFKPLLGLVRNSRDMYAIGLLFGLSFDTATEVGVLGIAAIEAGKGLPVWTILIFPALFTAGMSLLDTTDGILMLGAYGWALLDPLRKLYYNVTVTSASVVVAIVVGVMEVSGITGRGAPPSWLGFGIAGSFALAWTGSMSFGALRRYLTGTVSPKPSAASHASRWATYALPNESVSARTYDA